MSKVQKKPKMQRPIPVEMIEWWEKRRWIYNLIIILMTILILALYWEDVGIAISHSELIIDAFWMLVWCNILYTSGWVGGVLRIYYLGSYPFSGFGRWLLFSAGAIFSIVVLETHFSILIYPFSIG